MDASAIQNIIAQVWPEQTTDLDTIRACIESLNHHATVAVDFDDVAIGFVDGFITRDAHDRTRWEVDLLAVLSDYRGQGIAKRLVHDSTAHGLSKSVGLVRALTAVDNTPVHRVMEACGYVTDDVRHTLFVVPTSKCQSESSAASGHFITVDTLTYRGVWIEDDFSDESLQHGLYLAAQQSRDVAGVIMPASDVSAAERATKFGFGAVGDYFWYTKTP